MLKNKIQVDVTHYEFEKYVSKKRWISYYYQLQFVVDSACSSVLVIGKGDNIVPECLKLVYGRDDIEIDTFDFDPCLNPTILGDIREIDKIVKKKYDCVICCQVLEHLEFEYFEKVIKGISNICKKKFIISLPVSRFFHATIHTDVSLLQDIYIKIVIPNLFKKYSSRMEHRWELGNLGKSKIRIGKILEQYFTVEKKMYVPDFTFHYFWVCNKI